MISFLGAGVAISLLATACSGGAKGNGATSDDPVTLTFAAVTFTESGRGEALTEWVQGFNDSQDRITVEPLGIPFATFAQTVLTQAAGGEGPDLIRWDQADYVQAATEGLLEPLEDHIDFSKYNLIEGTDKYTIIDDERYGVMFDVSSYALIYNPELVSQPPTTPEEFRSVAKELTGDGKFGMAFRQTKEQEPGMMQDLFNYVYGFGGAFSDGEQLTFNSPEVIEGLSFYQDLYNDQVIPQGADAATYRRMMAEGLVAMNIDNGGVPSILHGQNPDLNLAAARNPFPVDAQGGIFVPMTINANSKHPEAAAEFIEWMLESENQVALQSVMGASTVATVTERPAEQIAAAPYLEVFDELVQTARPQVIEGFEAKTPQLRTIIVDEVLNALHGTKTMQEAMDDAQKAGEALVSR